MGAIAIAMTALLVGKCSGIASTSAMPEHEPLFNSLVGSLMGEGLMPRGDILDVGASYGHWSNFYANLDPSRTVFAIDPLEKNVGIIRSVFGRHAKNIVASTGTFGARDEWCVLQVRVRVQVQHVCV
ncbi:hypothetical protein T492DRAFT_40005 [Pavlovales sp. CCMP2436]|nr:hypothetical protein T492DRAFT_40005 [Pavlovales sp. CCMP2436]